MRDWQEWHRSYEDPSSSLARRLTVVRGHVAEALAAPRQSPIRILSLCSGDGRDLLPVLARSTHPTHTALLIEQDPTLAETARQTAADLNLDCVTVITADAGDPARFAGAPPVDLLLLCGIFGNISELDIRTVVTATPALLSDGGTVIWTRGSADPDLRPTIRRWFTQAGLREVAFDSEPAGFGVGVAIKPAGARTESRLPPRLFRFIR